MYDYQKHGSQVRKPTVQEESHVEETVQEESHVEEILLKAAPAINVMGVVVNCVLLNVREGPSITSAPLEVLNVGVTVECSNETSGFIKVHTPSGVDGYCMREYIHLRTEGV